MSKCIQSFLETIYWYCCEQWFCYDKNIALYEDPDIINNNFIVNDSKTFNYYENQTYWNGVSVAAKKSEVVVMQPKQVLQTTESYNSVQSKFEQNLNPDKNSMQMSADLDVENVATKKQETVRKKSLQERRKSQVELRLKLDDVPIIKQNRMPKFYLDTPEISDSETNKGSMNCGLASALSTPILPNNEFQFDLKAVTLMYLEPVAATSSCSLDKQRKRDYSFSKLFNFKQKLRPLIAKSPMSKSMPEFSLHL